MAIIKKKHITTNAGKDEMKKESLYAFVGNLT
jgi:hypothetical protein